MFIRCPDCGGRRFVEVLVQNSEGDWVFEPRDCSNCHGAGEVYDSNSKLGDDSDKSAG